MSTLAELLAEYRESHAAEGPTGAFPTDIPGVLFFWDETHVDRSPLLYDTGLVIIGQGYKTGFLGGHRFDYGTETCLVVGVPVPFDCEAHGTPDEPLLGIRIDVNLDTLHRLVAQFRGRLGLDGGTPFGVEAVKMEGALMSAAKRLMETLRDPMDAEALGPAVVDEILYRILQSHAGPVLYSLVQHHTSYAAIARALERIHTDYRESLTVDELAVESAMSASSFHRAFKQITGETPLQYLKKVRLLKAKGLLVYQGARVDEAAYEVGYASPSQFSREFKRYFKVPPSEAASLPYSAAV